MVDGGKAMEVTFTVDDPDTFNAPWQATHRYRRIVRPATYEEVCAENNQHLFDYHIPIANKPDFLIGGVALALESSPVREDQMRRLAMMMAINRGGGYW